MRASPMRNGKPSWALPRTVPRQGNLGDQFPHLSSIPSRVGWLNARPLTAQQVSQRLQDAGYDGDVSIVKDCAYHSAVLTLARTPASSPRRPGGEWGRVPHASDRGARPPLDVLKLELPPGDLSAYPEFDAGIGRGGEPGDDHGHD